MSITRTTCPFCQASLKLAKALPAGKLIKCPRCGKSIRVSAEDPGEEGQEREDTLAAPSHREKGGRPKTSRVPVEEEGEEDEEVGDKPQRRRPARKPRKSKTNPALLWGAVGGGVLLIGIVVGVVILLSSRSRPSPAPTTGDNAGANKPTPPPGQPAAAVELSGAEAHADAETVEDARAPVVACSVKYRFTNGAPPLGWYMFMVDTGAGTSILARVSAAELKAEGTITKRVSVFNYAKVSPTWKFRLEHAGGMNGPYRPISNVAEGPFRRGTPTAGQEVIKLTAEQLLQEYEADRAATAQKYKGKRLAVDGVVYRVHDRKELPFAIVVVISRTDAEMGKNSRYLSAQIYEPMRAQLAHLKEGQHVRVEGRCSGSTEVMELENAKLTVLNN